MSSDCNHERLVNSASTSQSSLCIFSFILGESRFIRFSTSIDSPFIFTIFHRISIERTMLRIQIKTTKIVTLSSTNYYLDYVITHGRRCSKLFIRIKMHSYILNRNHTHVFTYMIIDRNGLYHYIDFSKINCSFERSNVQSL